MWALDPEEKDRREGIIHLENMSQASDYDIKSEKDRVDRPSGPLGRA